MRVYNCSDCGVKKSKKGIYCKTCRYNHATRPSGLTYTTRVKNKGWFKKGAHSNPDHEFKNGQTPWNKGLKGVMKANSGSFTSERTTGERNHKWAADNVGYSALHSWVYRKMGKASECKQCGSKENVDWSNISWEYKRDVSDWQELCRSCHLRYDQANWGIATRTFKLTMKEVHNV